MKTRSIRTLVSIFLSAVILLSSVPGAFAAVSDARVTEFELLTTRGEVADTDFIESASPEHKARRYSSLWFSYATFNDEIPEECYDHIYKSFSEETFASSEYPQISDNCYFELVNYTRYKDTVYIWYRMSGLTLDAVIADIETGELLRVGGYSDYCTGGAFDLYNVGRIKLPEFFDPDKHTLLLTPIISKTKWQQLSSDPETGIGITYAKHIPIDPVAVNEIAYTDFPDSWDEPMLKTKKRFVEEARKLMEEVYSHTLTEEEANLMFINYWFDNSSLIRPIYADSYDTIENSFTSVTDYDFSDFSLTKTILEDNTLQVEYTFETRYAYATGGHGNRIAVALVEKSTGKLYRLAIVDYLEETEADLYRIDPDTGECVPANLGELDTVYIPSTDPAQVLYEPDTDSYVLRYEKSDLLSVFIELPDYYSADEYDVCVAQVHMNDGKSYEGFNFVFEEVIKILPGEHVYTSELDPKPEPLYGDANGDGAVNLLDVSAILKYVAEWEDVTVDIALSDMNGNGRIGLADAAAILRAVAFD